MSEETEITLGVLNAVHDNSRVTQRSVAKDLGIALGLTNSYLKRCIKKGLIKVQQAPANRYAYYLTPQGFTEKSRLTAEYVTQGFKFFRIAKSECAEIFEICHNRGWNRVALHGLTDIAEIAVLSATNADIEIVGVIDRSSALMRYAGAPVVDNFEKLSDVDAIVITDLGKPQVSYDLMVSVLSESRVFAPGILNVTTGPAPDSAEGSQ